MAKGRASPGVGRVQGQNLPDQSALRGALAIEILDKAAIAELNERRKRNRKKAESNGVVLEDLDRLFKMKDSAPSEIETWMRRTWNAIGSIFGDLYTQFELFAPKPGAPERRAAHRHVGLMAGLQGKPGDPPPGLAGDDLNLFLEGFEEGCETRDAAQAERLEILNEALANADKGIVTDGTGKKRGRPKKGMSVAEAANRDAAEQVREQSAKDFAQDQVADNVVPIGGKSKLPETTEEGVSRTAEPKADDFVESTPEELAAQITRTGPTGPGDQMVDAKMLNDEPVVVRADDPRLYNGRVYGTPKDAELAKAYDKPMDTAPKAEHPEATKRKRILKSQSEKAAEIKAEAGLQ